MANILVVEDEADLRMVIEFNLKKAGHDVRLACSGAEGLRLARESRPDLVLLDLMLPDIGGFDVCRQLKESENSSTVAVVMLTARGEEVDRVAGFKAGADDYVVKPFSVRELLLRIDAILRRTQAEQQGEQGVVVFGKLKIDRAAHRVWVENEEIELTALEFKLLMTLYERRHRVQSRGELLRVVWGVSADITTRTVDTHVKRLREKIKSARDYLETVRGVGYRFVSEPDEVSSPTES